MDQELETSSFRWICIIENSPVDFIGCPNHNYNFKMKLLTSEMYYDSYSVLLGVVWKKQAPGNEEGTANWSNGGNRLEARQIKIIRTTHRVKIVVWIKKTKYVSTVSCDWGNLLCIQETLSKGEKVRFPGQTKAGFWSDIKRAPSVTYMAGSLLIFYWTSVFSQEGPRNRVSRTYCCIGARVGWFTLRTWPNRKKKRPDMNKLCSDRNMYCPYRNTNDPIGILI